MRHLRRLVLFTALVLCVPWAIAPTSGQVPATATLSVSIDVQGTGGAPPNLGPLEVTPLGLQVTERACGGPSFLAAFLASDTAALVEPPAGVTVVDADVLRVDVEVPASIDGTPCEYTVDPAGSLLCYQALDVVAGPDGSGPVLNLAGAPTGEAVVPSADTVVEVLGRYAVSCADLRFVVDGIGGSGTLRAALVSAPLDPLDLSRSCDYGSFGPDPVLFEHVEGVVVVDSRVAGCSAALTVLVEGCTVTPAPDEFTMAAPVTERAFVATCAQVPPPVVEEPTFTG